MHVFDGLAFLYQHILWCVYACVCVCACVRNWAGCVKIIGGYARRCLGSYVSRDVRNC